MVVKEKKASNDFVDKKYELVPPDGGWGYLVAISAIINFGVTSSFLGCFGMLYNDFLIEKAMSSTGMTTLSGVFWMSAALAGYYAFLIIPAFLTSTLLTTMSMRKLGFTSAVIGSCGTLGTVVMTSPLMFFLFAGIMQGFTTGVLYNLTCTIMNDYFTKKRILIMSFVQTATGVLGVVAPMFVKWSLDKYGSKGTLLLIGGIWLHCIPAVIMMQPVKWHMKQVVLIETAEIELLLVDNKDVKKVATPVVNLTDLEEYNKKEDTEKAFDFPENDEKKSIIKKFLESLIDTSLLKTYLFSCVSFGPALCNTADGIFVLILPQYLYSMKWTQENVAFAIAIYGFGDVTMRVIFTLLSKWMFKLGISRIYIGGVAVAVLSRIGMLWSSSVTATMVYLTLAGSSRCSISILIPLVVSEAVAPEKFTSALGISLLLNGTSSFALGPAVGAVRDLTNSYSAAFYTVISFYVIIVVLWPIEMVITSKKQRKKIVKTNSNLVN